MLHLMSLHIIHKPYQRLSINRFSLCRVARCRLVRMTPPLCVATAKCLCFVSIRVALSTPLPSVTPLTTVHWPLTTQMQYRSPSPAVSTASRSSHKSRVGISCVWAWHLLCAGCGITTALECDDSTQKQFPNFFLKNFPQILKFFKFKISQFFYSKCKNVGMSKWRSRRIDIYTKNYTLFWIVMIFHNTYFDIP